MSHAYSQQPLISTRAKCDVPIASSPWFRPEPNMTCLQAGWDQRSRDDVIGWDMYSWVLRLNQSDPFIVYSV
jgi:hypothetical protein